MKLVKSFAVFLSLVGTGATAEDISSLKSRAIEAVESCEVSEIYDVLRTAGKHGDKELHEILSRGASCISDSKGTAFRYSESSGSFAPEVDQAQNDLIQQQTIFLEKLKSQRNRLEKRKSCVSIKIGQVNTDLEAINKRFEQSNQALILDETHEACVELYSSDKPSAMINSTCVEAFQRKGHPSLVFSESEQLANLSAGLLELIELEEGLEEELISTKIQLLEADGVVTKEELNQKVADDLEAKSCAEFGYEGVYLD